MLRAQTTRNDQIGNMVVPNFPNWFYIILIFFSFDSPIFCFFYLCSLSDGLNMLSVSVFDKMSWLEQIPKLLSTSDFLSLKM